MKIQVELSHNEAIDLLQMVNRYTDSDLPHRHSAMQALQHSLATTDSDFQEVEKLVEDSSKLADTVITERDQAIVERRRVVFERARAVDSLREAELKIETLEKKIARHEARKKAARKAARAKVISTADLISKEMKSKVKKR